MNLAIQPPASKNQATRPRRYGHGAAEEQHMGINSRSSQLLPNASTIQHEKGCDGYDFVYIMALVNLPPPPPARLTG